MQAPVAHPVASVRHRALTFAVIVLAGSAACAPDGDSTMSAASLSDVAVLERGIDLQENDAVINVNPLVSVDPRGGFLVADSREAQVRRYGGSGELLWYAGARGSGPGEFRQPRVVVRLRDGNVVVLDQGGRITTFDSLARTVVHTTRSPFRFVEDAKVLDDSVLLVSAILRGKGQGPRIHLWNTRRDTVQGSFFEPFLRVRNPVAATIAGWSKLSVRGDTVAVVFALSDSVHFFSRRGEPHGSVPIPFVHFRRVGPHVPEGGDDPAKRERWLTSFDYVADVHWLPGGDLLVPYQSVVPGGAYTRDWHLVRMTRAGRPVFELRSIPRLLTVDPGSGALYLVKPGAEVPNQWTLAHLRP